MCALILSTRWKLFVCLFTAFLRVFFTRYFVSLLKMEKFLRPAKHVHKILITFPSTPNCTARTHTFCNMKDVFLRWQRHPKPHSMLLHFLPATTMLFCYFKTTNFDKHCSISDSNFRFLSFVHDKFKNFFRFYFQLLVDKKYEMKNS